jgi:hypothetical protein
MRIDRLRTLFVLALGLATLASLCGEALAQKKGGGTTPPAPGTIYFSGRAKAGPTVAMSMKGDGTDKRQVASGLHRRPTYQTHGGARWFLVGDYDYDGPLDEFGLPPLELFASNGQGQFVQLTGGSNPRWANGGDVLCTAWGKDDSFLSYPAWWFNESGGVSGGLFAVDIDWSTGVPAVAGPPVLLFEAEAYWDFGWQGYVNVSEHDWSPDGLAVVFREDEGINSTTYVADFSGGVPAYLPIGLVRGAVWSPDGSRIAFSDGAIWTARPDGTDAVRLTTHTVTSNEERLQGSPSWSPDGAYIAYGLGIVSRKGTQNSVWRIPSGGGTAVNLTGDLAYAGGPRWRP